MRQAMAGAEVGDDVYAEDPTVNRLQAVVAEMTGFEAGLFVSSGTLGNQIAIAVHVRPGSEVVCTEGAHIYEYEPGSMALIASALPRLVPTVRGVPDPLDVEAAIHDSIHQTPTGLVALENTHNRAGGTVVPLATQRAVQDVARRHGLPIHLDGARAFNAAAALGVPVAEVCRGFDSVSICLSKGLGAPVGSVLVGSRQFIATAHRYRKMLGGGMRQAGILAAAGLVAVSDMPALLVRDHERARGLAESVARLPTVAVDLDSVQTNIVYFQVHDADGFVRACSSRGVRLNAMGRSTVRAVTHHQIDDADIDRAVEVMTAVMEERSQQAAVVGVGGGAVS
jgi:threonine aldolase